MKDIVISTKEDFIFKNKLFVHQYKNCGLLHYELKHFFADCTQPSGALRSRRRGQKFKSTTQTIKANLYGRVSFYAKRQINF